MGLPPPLPPRDTSNLPPPPPYSAIDEPLSFPSPPGLTEPSSGLAADPRCSSVLSLVPSRLDQDSRRTLLLIYIHGFYGNDQSFRSFPAHVHNHLRHALADTHVIHSKVYPRYKTYKSIEIARDNFSAWLEPHESPVTDTILVGHSMGGLLAAEVALKPSENPSQPTSFKHRILGTLSLDSPFLGLHPGIVVSGISSLFSPAPPPPGESITLTSPDSDSRSTISQAPVTPPSTSEQPRQRSTDPNFDAPFFNDEPFREQPFLSRLFNFGNKHWSEGLFNAIANHVSYHLEFGGCLADYTGLMTRYNKLRRLEDVNELNSLSEAHSAQSLVRIRFCNYYTLSPGRPKPLPPPAGESKDSSQADLSNTMTTEQAMQMQEPGTVGEESTSSPSLQIGVEEAEKHQPDSTNLAVPTAGQKAGGSQEMAAAAQEASIHVDDDDNDDERSGSSLDLKRLSMLELDPVPMDDDSEVTPEETSATATSLLTTKDTAEEADSTEEFVDAQQEISPQQSTLDLPPIPELPPQPEKPDFSQYTDKDARKQAEKEFNRLQKVYDQAVKDRTKAVREREKLIEKREKKAAKDAGKIMQDAKKGQDKREKDAKKEQDKKEKDAKKAQDKLVKATRKEQEKLEREQQKSEAQEKKRLEKEAAAAAKRADEGAKRAAAEAAAIAQHAGTERATTTTTTTPSSGISATGQWPKKLKKFCNTPGKTNGVMDPTWIDVFMDDMDEVTAHCALFLPGPHYDDFVADVAGRMVKWVHEDTSTRAALEMD